MLLKPLIKAWLTWTHYTPANLQIYTNKLTKLLFTNTHCLFLQIIIRKTSEKKKKKGTGQPKSHELCSAKKHYRIQITCTREGIKKRNKAAESDLPTIIRLLCCFHFYSRNKNLTRYAGLEKLLKRWHSYLSNDRSYWSLLACPTSAWIYSRLTRTLWPYQSCGCKFLTFFPFFFVTVVVGPQTWKFNVYFYGNNINQRVEHIYWYVGEYLKPKSGFVR